jgi:hypothetical protein
MRFKSIKTGAGNYLMNPKLAMPKVVSGSQSDEENKEESKDEKKPKQVNLEAVTKPCVLCRSETPDSTEIQNLIIGMCDEMTTPLDLEEGKPIIVDSFQTLAKAHESIMSSSSLGIDLEGSLRAGGYIVLL